MTDRARTSYAALYREAVAVALDVDMTHDSAIKTIERYRLEAVFRAIANQGVRTVQSSKMIPENWL